MKRTTETNRLLSRGMALHAGQSSMEQRVRAVFARRRSAWFARVAAAALALGLGLACFTTACKPTVETAAPTPAQVEILTAAGEPVDAGLDAGLDATPPAGPYAAPARLDYTLAGKRADLDIRVAAEVAVPEQTAWPVYDAARRRLTQADADALLAQFVGQADFVGIDGGSEPASKQMQFHRAIPNILWSYGPRIDTPDGGRTSEWTEEAVQAATAAGNTAVIGRFRGRDNEWMRLRVVNEVHENYETSYVTLGVDGEEALRPERVAEGPLTEAEAKARADAIVAAVAPGYAYAATRPVEKWDDAAQRMQALEGAYALVYRMEYPGTVPSRSEAARPMMLTALDDGLLENARQTAYQSRILLMLDGEGVLTFHWDNPATAPRVLEENAALLPFPEIQAVLDDWLTTRFGPVEDGVEEAYLLGYRAEITRLELAYLPVAGADGALTYRPVWNVCGTVYARYNEQYELDREPGTNQYLLDENDERAMTSSQDGSVESSLLTIDAVDGSLLFRVD